MHRRILDNYDTVALVLALLILPMVALEYFSHIPTSVKNIFEGYYVFIYILFVIEFTARFLISKSKFLYAKKNWIQAAVIIFPFLHLTSIAPVLEGVFLIIIERTTRRFVRPHHYSVFNMLIFLVIVVFISSEMILFLKNHIQQAKSKHSQTHSGGQQ